MGSEFKKEALGSHRQLFIPKSGVIINDENVSFIRIYNKHSEYCFLMTSNEN